MNDTSARFVLIGLSGIAETLLHHWISSRAMPRLEAVLADAARGTLRSSHPAGSAASWSSLITGRTPPRHGIYDFEFLDPRLGEIRRATADRLRTVDLWSLVEHDGCTAPRGSALSRPRLAIDPQGRRRSTVRMIASDADAPVRRRFVALSTGAVWRRRPKTAVEVEALALRQASDIRRTVAAAESADALRPWNALSVRLRCLAGLQRHLWPELQSYPSAPGAEAAWGSSVTTVLEALDEAVGRLAELAASRGAALALVSENGYGPCRSLINVNGILRIHGIQNPSGHATRLINRNRRRLARLHRQGASRLFGACGLPTGDPLHSRNDCDWSRTLAFSPFGEDAGLVWLTPKARRHNARSERVTMEIAEIFRLIADPATGQPVFSDVIPVGPRWNIDPAESGWPEIVAVPAEGYAPTAEWRFKEKARIFRPDSNQPAAVHDQGFIALQGTKVPTDLRIRAQVVDVLPTLLDHLGIGIAEDLEGTPIRRPADRSIYHPHVRPDGARSWRGSDDFVQSERFPVT